MYRIMVEQLPVSCPEIHRWCLDYPIKGGDVSPADLQSDGVLFQGWVLPSHPAAVSPFVRTDGKTLYFDLNVERPDVIKRVLALEPAGHPLLNCGFRLRVPLNAQDAVFGFRIGSHDFDYARLTVVGREELKVMEGLDGWLFLDNDTNRSVEQFTGELLLDRSGRKGWSAYLNGLARVASDLNARHAVLIAPAKEMVLPQYYPHEKGALTPVEQVLMLAKQEHQLVYPVPSFQASGERTVLMMDSHWTLYGAMLAVLDTVGRLGIDKDQVQALFAEDLYREREIGGDLGNKFYPRRTSREKILVSYNYIKCIVYDNHLPNLGRVQSIENKSALFNCKCVLFGSSSGYSTLHFFSRIFSRVIFVHSAGNVDTCLLSRESPEYIVAQTNGRFVIVPPVVGYDLSRAISEKLTVLSDAQRSETLEKAGNWLKGNDQSQAGYYHAMLQSGAR